MATISGSSSTTRMLAPCALLMVPRYAARLPEVNHWPGFATHRSGKCDTEASGVSALDLDRDRPGDRGSGAHDARGCPRAPGPARRVPVVGVRRGARPRARQLRDPV